jgi:hypothetical protein
LELQKSLFESREGEVFYLQGPNDTRINLALTEVDSPEKRILHQTRGTEGREPFTLLFHGPLETFLQQQMVVLRHDELGQLELFLVPVNQDDEGYYYEAVFG